MALLNNKNNNNSSNKTELPPYQLVPQVVASSCSAVLNHCNGSINNSGNNHGNNNCNTTTMMVIDTIDAMNNEALGLLFEGHYEDATRALVQCLRQIIVTSQENDQQQQKQKIEDSQDKANSPEDPIMSSTSLGTAFIKRLVPTSMDGVIAPYGWSSSYWRNVFSSFLPYRAAFALNHYEDEQEEDSEDEDMDDLSDANFASSDPLLASAQPPQLPDSDHASSEKQNQSEIKNDATTTSITPTLLSSMVTFNLAMIYHESGMVEGNIPHIAMARSLYQSAATTITNSEDNGNKKADCNNHDSSNSDLLLFELALHNNLGHVHAILGDDCGIRESREKMQRLLTTTTCVNSSSHRSSCSFLDSSAAGLFRESLARANNIDSSTPPPPPAA